MFKQLGLIVSFITAILLVLPMAAVRRQLTGESA